MRILAISAFTAVCICSCAGQAPRTAPALALAASEEPQLAPAGWVHVHLVFDDIELAKKLVSSPELASAMQSAGVPSPMTLLVIDEGSHDEAVSGPNVVIASAAAEQRPAALEPAAAVEKPALIDVDHNIDWAEVTGLKNAVVVAHFMAPDADRALQLLESPAFRDALSASGATGRPPVTYTRDVVIAIRPRR